MINLTIQSSTDKIIELSNIDNNTLLASIGTNETVNLPYNNIHLNIVSSTASYSLNNIWSNVDSMTNDMIFIFIVLLIIVVVFAAPKILKRL